MVGILYLALRCTLWLTVCSGDEYLEHYDTRCIVNLVKELDS